MHKVSISEMLPCCDFVWIKILLAKTMPRFLLVNQQEKCQTAETIKSYAVMPGWPIDKLFGKQNIGSEARENMAVHWNHVNGPNSIFLQNQMKLGWWNVDLSPNCAVNYRIL